MERRKSSQRLNISQEFSSKIHLGFVGDPYDANSFGTFNEPIFDVVNHFTHQAENLTTKSLSEIIEILKKDRKPIVCWVTLELKEPRVTDTWIDVEGTLRIFQEFSKNIK